LEETALDLDTLIVTTFCTLDDLMTETFRDRRVRERGPQPTMADSEVLTIEVIGEYLELGKDTAIFDYFRRHYAHFFPALARVHRTTFTRQGANLWKVKEVLWQRLVARTASDSQLAILDSFPVPVCRFAGSVRCKRFRGEAAYGKDTTIKQIFYGFRLHARVCWPGVVTRLVLAPANISDLAEVEALLEQTHGTCLGDRNYWSPELAEALGEKGLRMLAPFKKRDSDPNRQWSARIGGVRRHIETVFSQMCERYTFKRVWARDLWHVGSRMLRKVLSHTLCFVLNQTQEHSPLRLARLLTL